MKKMKNVSNEDITPVDHLIGQGVSLLSPMSARRVMKSYDATLLWAWLILLALGLVMVYSASLAVAEVKYHDAMYFFNRQLIYLTISLLIAALAFQVPMKTWRKWAPVLFIGCLILLMLVLIPKFGRQINGARRWLSLGFIRLQPSELMKFAVILFAAGYAVRRAEYLPASQPMKMTILKGFIPLCVVMCAVGALLLMEPDFGSFFVIAVIAFGILFLGGLDWRIMLASLVTVPAVLYKILISAVYRSDRMIFTNPWADPFGKGYQLTQSEMAFGRGDLFGVGLGDGIGKLLYLPEPHTDFILAVIGEELGFIGVAAVILLFGWILFRAWQIGTQAVRLKQHFSALTAYGIGLWLGLQAFINMGGNLTILPPKGITLPFLSYGGSGLVLDCLMIVVLLRVDYENRRLLNGHTI
jgi:cell division protein FtsW